MLKFKVLKVDSGQFMAKGFTAKNSLDAQKIVEAYFRSLGWKNIKFSTIYDFTVQASSNSIVKQRKIVILPPLN
jgi:hypothetical protein